MGSHEWIMCDKMQEVTIDYNCERRPWMTIALVVSILLFFIIRKQEYIIPPKPILDEEEELMANF